ncbi:MmcQ/YjbR family DNA-binding protein [Thalassotalea maritima]|uniref:MmcQ/YjbR family DNA-binding protein n=1 Tax=Thalassotalea maritima TaxID=3242416 RepID=UPI00352913CF
MDSIRQYLSARPMSYIDFPFGNDVEVYKVKGKVYALLSCTKITALSPYQVGGWWLNLKCEPSEAIMLRDIFPAVIPGYHMNKRLWNTVIIDGSIAQGEIERMIDNSFLLVVNTLKKTDRASVLVHL